MGKLSKRILEEIKVYYRSGDRYEDGLYVAGSETEERIMASMQRLSMAERQLLPEGFRTQDTYKMYTETPLIQTLINDRLTDAAEFLYRGQRFAMLAWERWDFLIPHWKVTMVGKDG